MAATRILYCIPGSWTEEWFDNPGAWWQWACAFLGWSVDEWRAFYTRWRTAPDAKRAQMSEATGLRFFDWRNVPGGSIRGAARAAADLVAAELATLPPEADVTLVGHSKGGNVIKHLLTVPREWTGARPARAILVDAPIDWLRETVSWLFRLGIERCAFPSSVAVDIPMATVNNWLDPSGGRLRGVRNYQTFVWQDYLTPYPPHGMKGFLAAQVLSDLGALLPEAGLQERPAYTDAPSEKGAPAS